MSLLHITCIDKNIVALDEESQYIYDVIDYQNVSDEPIMKTLPIDDDFYIRQAEGIKTIAGSVYVYGVFNKIFKRLHKANWIDITIPEKNPQLFQSLIRRRESSNNIGGALRAFTCIDGFSENDLYAGGENGFLWHYDGKAWNAVDLPTSMNITSIICSTDGVLYLSSKNDSYIIVGQKNSFETIKVPHSFTSSVWFKDKIYFTDGNKLYTLKNRSIEIVKFTESVPRLYGIKGLRCSKDLMVLYSDTQVFTYDGITISELVGVPPLEQTKS